MSKTSENKITYYLGAGASAQALPTVKRTSMSDGLSYSLLVLSEELKNNTTINSNYNDFRERLINNLHWLSKNSDKFGTVDTFAKFLYLKKRPMLGALKETLSMFFIIRQLIDKKVDDRALIFLTSVMQQGEIFPTNIKILNWNYDFQIQLAAEMFRKEIFNKETYTPALIPYSPSFGGEASINLNELSMVHLNGIASFFSYMNYIYDSNNLNSSSKDINDIFEEFMEGAAPKYELLTFAWEKEKDTTAAYILKNRLNYATTLVKETDILVVVGYSFPFFNREIDKEIFSSLKASGRLKKIYFQDPFKTGEFLYNQFNLDRNIEIKHITETDNYYIPFEL